MVNHPERWTFALFSLEFWTTSPLNFSPVKCFLPILPAKPVIVSTVLLAKPAHYKLTKNLLPSICVWLLCVDPFKVVAAPCIRHGKLSELDLRFCALLQCPSADDSFSCPVTRFSLSLPTSWRYQMPSHLLLCKDTCSTSSSSFHKVKLLIEHETNSSMYIHLPRCTPSP